jgi:hypothetical protein
MRVLGSARILKVSPLSRSRISAGRLPGDYEAMNPAVSDLLKRALALSVDERVAFAKQIRDHLFWLQAVWATTLSSDLYQEAEKFRAIFQELCGQLRQQDPAAANRLIAGHEALLLSEPAPPKPRISLATQNMIELVGEIQGAHQLQPVESLRFGGEIARVERRAGQVVRRRPA